VIGAYSVSSSTLDLKLMLGFGLLGYVMRKLDYEPAPLCLAFILGPLLETSLQQSLIISQGSFMIFVTRPITAVSFAITFLLFLSTFLRPIVRGLANIKAFGSEEN
jgi:putative tricarboxylic transport membrane protein